MGKSKEASEVLSEFLDFLDACESQYQAARDAVGLEDRRLQDLLHELEFAQDKAERNRVATKFQRSRRDFFCCPFISRNFSLEVSRLLPKEPAHHPLHALRDAGIIL